MSIASKLGKLSSFFFTTGFIFGKAQSLPIPILSSFFSLCSLFSYLIGYGFWFISSHYYPLETHKSKGWYAFMAFKAQQLFAALLGLLAMGLSIAAFFLPVLMIPAAWVLVISNTFWAIGEYHKFRHPPLNDPEYSHPYQKYYVGYSLSISVASVVGALSATLISIFPLAFLPIFIVSSALIFSLGGISIAAYLNYYFTPVPTEKAEPSEVLQVREAMNEPLEPRLTKLDTQNTLKPPYHGPGVFLEPKPEIEEETMNATQAPQSSY